MTPVSIITEETNTPNGILTIEIVFQVHVLGYIVPAVIKSMGNLTIGSDESSDIIWLPGGIDIELYFGMHKKDLIDLFKYIENRIENNWCSVYIKLNSNLIWQGYISRDPDDLSLDNNIIKMHFIDQTERLRDIDPRTNPFGYTYLGDFKKIVDIIKDFFINQIFVDDNYITNIIETSTIEGRIFANGQYITFPFSEFMATLDFYFSPNNVYDNLLNLLKSICLNYNLILYVAPNRTLFLTPRFDEPMQIREIRKSELLETPEYEMIEGIKGMRLKVWTGSYPKDNPANYYIKIYGDFVEGDENCEELIIDQPAGTWETGGYSGIAISYGSQIYWIELNEITYKKIDNSYANYDSLYNIIGKNTWERIKYPRLKTKIIVNGILDQWSPNQFYKLDDSDIIFRGTKYEYDILKNQTTIYLREVGVIPNSLRLLEDGTYRLCENDSRRLLEQIGGGQVIGEIIYRTLEDGFNRLTENGEKRII